MRYRLAIAVVVLQVGLLAFMAGQREWVARFGAPLVLRTAPIDPNDPMRGAYVRLDYEASYVPVALCRGEVVKWTKSTDWRVTRQLCDRVVYATVKVDDYGIAELTTLSDLPQPGGVFLRGRLEGVDSRGVRLRYGVEALFMSKEAAKRMEAMASKEKAGAPINARIAVASSGLAVLQGTAWEPLGLTITFDRPPPRQPAAPGQTWQRPPLTGLTATLHNYGDQDLAIVNLPGAKSFRLARNTRFNDGNYAWVGEPLSDRPPPTAEAIIVLKPGAKHDVHLDLTQPQWWVTDTRKPGSGPIPLQM